MATDVRAVLIKLVGDNDTKKAFAGVNKSLGNIKKGISQLGKFTLASGLAAGAAANISAEFSIKMAEVNTMLDDSGEQVGIFRKEILSLSKETGKAPLELAEALRQTLSAGVDTAEAMEFLSKTTKAGIGSVAETIEVVDLATNAMNAFGKENLKLDRILDSTQQTIKLGKTTMTELAESMGVLFQPAAAIGLEFEDISAALATLTKGGVKTVNAVTQLKAIMSGVLKPTEATSDAAERLGIDFSATALKSKGLIGFMKGIKEATKGNSEEMAKLFPNVRGLGAAFTLTGRQSDEYKIILDQLTNSTGASNEAFEKVSDSGGFKFKKLMNDLKVLTVQFGEVAIPVILDTVGALVKFEKENTTLVRSVGALTAALVLLNVTGLGLMIKGLVTLAANAIPLAVSGVVSLTTSVIALNAATGSLGLTFGVIAISASIIIAKIAAVGAAGYAAGRGISALIEVFNPGQFRATVDLIERAGRALGFFDSALTGDDLAAKRDEFAARAQAIKAREAAQSPATTPKEGPVTNLAQADSGVQGKNQAMLVRNAIVADRQAQEESWESSMRELNTQSSGALQAGGNGI